nr:heavy metal-associated domain-containing protein [Kitasatospora acidiphila]
MSSTVQGPVLPTGEEDRVELLIGGMTCASCAARIEKRLNKMEGVTATVNYATEKAKVSFPSGITPEDLVAQVEKAGYTATLPLPPSPGASRAAPGARPPRTGTTTSPRCACGC